MDFFEWVVEKKRIKEGQAAQLTGERGNISRDWSEEMDVVPKGEELHLCVCVWASLCVTKITFTS